MAPVDARHDRPGFLIYYAFEDEASEVSAEASRLWTVTRRTATVVAVLVLVAFLGLTVGPVFRL
ncbi:hypothetical protein ACFQ07_19070 [Actinomadura adrarensis]|uniref:Uncharacterized protein n=1 Tax=Actinomadura adrarensis TaxID=1819600 RepID=A0ABW3CIY0_9ACTN